MSVLNKKPYIQIIISSLTEEQRSNLLKCVNGETTIVKAFLFDLPEGI